MKPAAHLHEPGALGDLETFLPPSAAGDGDDELRARLDDAATRAGVALSAAVRRELAVVCGGVTPVRGVPAGLGFAVHLGDTVVGALVVANPTVVALADLQMGGAGLPSERAATELERTLAAELLAPLVQPFVWIIRAHETQVSVQPLAEAVTVPRESVLVDLALEGTGNELRAALLCAASEERAGGMDVAGVAAAFAAVPVDVAVRFQPVTTHAIELCGMSVGDVLCLDHRVDTPLDACVDGRPLLRVALGRHHGHAAVRVHDLIERSQG